MKNKLIKIITSVSAIATIGTVSSIALSNCSNRDIEINGVDNILKWDYNKYANILTRVDYTVSPYDDTPTNTSMIRDINDHYTVGMAINSFVAELTKHVQSLVEMLENASISIKDYSFVKEIGLTIDAKLAMTTKTGDNSIMEFKTLKAAPIYDASFSNNEPILTFGNKVDTSIMYWEIMMAGQTFSFAHFELDQFLADWVNVTLPTL